LPSYLIIVGSAKYPSTIGFFVVVLSCPNKFITATNNAIAKQKT
jgi:hypothetical protein